MGRDAWRAQGGALGRACQGLGRRQPTLHCTPQRSRECVEHCSSLCCSDPLRFTLVECKSVTVDFHVEEASDAFAFSTNMGRHGALLLDSA